MAKAQMADELRQLKLDAKQYQLKLLASLISDAASLQEPLSAEDWPEDSHSGPDPELISLKARVARLEALASQEADHGQG